MSNAEINFAMGMKTFFDAMPCITYIVLILGFTALFVIIFQNKIDYFFDEIRKKKKELNK
jgi:hypothetical protein